MDDLGNAVVVVVIFCDIVSSLLHFFFGISHSTADMGGPDQSGDKSTADAQDFEENTVFEKQENGAETPYVKEITEPEVEGVIVAADGGNNAKTAADITDAVVALFGIEVHKIKVMKKV